MCSVMYIICNIPKINLVIICVNGCVLYLDVRLAVLLGTTAVTVEMAMGMSLIRLVLLILVCSPAD